MEVLVVPRLLGSLVGGLMSPTQHLEQQQALVKQFAEILEFVLKFDEYKVVTCVRPLSLFCSDASADGVEERSLVPRSRSHARLRRNATMSLRSYPTDPNTNICAIRLSIPIAAHRLVYARLKVTKAVACRSQIRLNGQIGHQNSQPRGRRQFLSTHVYSSPTITTVYCVARYKRENLKKSSRSDRISEAR
ncbi:Protein FAM49B [Eumeta japonica]|uniref:Protein FAM49B n=1 Tax=Eumeta variegata TaxID=151549 RepID=A0A4C1YUC5_EUMVA|nr:Protein FAM49B [Eumeta japonica]